MTRKDLSVGPGGIDISQGLRGSVYYVRYDTAMPTDWVLAEPVAGDPKRLWGHGGRNGVKGVLEALEDDRVQLFYLRMKYEDKAGTHTKFVLVTWVGPTAEQSDKEMSGKWRKCLEEEVFKEPAARIQVLGNKAEFTKQEVLRILRDKIKDIDIGIVQDPPPESELLGKTQVPVLEPDLDASERPHTVKLTKQIPRYAAS